MPDLTTWGTKHIFVIQDVIYIFIISSLAILHSNFQFISELVYIYIEVSVTLINPILDVYCSSAFLTCSTRLLDYSFKHFLVYAGFVDLSVSSMCFFLRKLPIQRRVNFSRSLYRSINFCIELARMVIISAHALRTTIINRVGESPSDLWISGCPLKA